MTAISKLNNTILKCRNIKVQSGDPRRGLPALPEKLLLKNSFPFESRQIQQVHYQLGIFRRTEAGVCV